MIRRPTLLLVRHGNTFEAGQKATWVGARTDMPLTHEGECQAQRAILYIQKNYSWVSAVMAGPLQRTVTMASIITAHLGSDFKIDERLREIDYGLWENKTNTEIRENYGPETLENWEQSGLWPKDMRWQPSRETLEVHLRDFLDEQKEKLKVGAVSRLAVTSNGILRIINAMLTGNPQGLASKVKTGHICALEPTDEGWHIRSWDEKPI